MRPKNIFDAAYYDGAVQQNIAKKYGHSAASGYLMTGGDANAVRDLNTFLTSRNLPGQRVTSYLAKRREADPQYHLNQRFSQGLPVTPQDVSRTNDAGLQMIAGTTAPIQKFPKPLNIFSKSKPKLPRVDKNTQQEMIDFIDYVRLKQPQNLPTELGATRIAEKFNFRMPKSTSGLANEFDRVLTTLRGR